MGKIYYLFSLFCLILIFPSSTLAQTQFTPADALRVKSLRSTALSPNGDYLVGLRSAAIKNRFDVDHFRFRDPSYIRPATFGKK